MYCSADLNISFFLWKWLKFILSLMWALERKRNFERTTQSTCWAICIMLFIYFAFLLSDVTWSQKKLGGSHGTFLKGFLLLVQYNIYDILVLTTIILVKVILKDFFINNESCMSRLSREHFNKELLKEKCFSNREKNTGQLNWVFLYCFFSNFQWKIVMCYLKKYSVIKLDYVAWLLLKYTPSIILQ